MAYVMWHYDGIHTYLGSKRELNRRKRKPDISSRLKIEKHRLLVTPLVHSVSTKSGTESWYRCRYEKKKPLLFITSFHDCITKVSANMAADLLRPTLEMTNNDQ